MEDILAKIRWNNDFIKEETEKVEGSSEIKKEIFDSCQLLSDALSDCFKINADKEKGREIMKSALIEFDKTIKKIDGDERNMSLFMLLITHIADIKFLLASEKEQERIMKLMGEDKRK